jgi:hypothetical protein
MLAAALQGEVAAYVAQYADQLDDNGHRLVVRNGYHQPREVLTAAGQRQTRRSLTPVNAGGSPWRSCRPGRENHRR